MEEDQDEIEDLTGKQRSLISQNTQLQTQLSEALQRSTELEEVKLGLESKVISHTYILSVVYTRYNGWSTLHTGHTVLIVPLNGLFPEL